VTGERRLSISIWAAASILAALSLASILYGGNAHEAQDLDARCSRPYLIGGDDPRYLLGADQLGRDLGARTLAGIRVSYMIALIGTAVSAVIGTLLGFLATRMKGIVEEAILMLVDIQASLPFILVAVAFLMIVKSSFLVLLVLLSLSGWGRYARLTRSLSDSAMKDGYALAVRALGASPGRVFFRHVLPNISSALIVNMALQFPAIMIAESSLSFLGIGIQPPLVSLGRLLGEGRTYLTTAWWISVLPGAVIFASTLAMTVVGDWMRDRLGES